jgi:hypothetical protein
VGAFDRNLASVAVTMFPCLVYFIQKFYELFTLSGIYEYTAARNYITVHH